MTLNPHAPKFLPKDRSRLLSIYRPELQTAMDASTSQDITDPIVPAKRLKFLRISITPQFQSN